jgi:copper(I)-binding protein
MIRRLLALTITLFLLTACAAAAPAGPKISVENAWARPVVVSSISTTPEMQGMTGASGTETTEMQGMEGMSGTETPEMQGMEGMAGSGPTSAAYFVIVNQGSEADTLIGATSEVANMAEMHETRIENNVAEMVPVPSVDVPAGGRVEFKPGGYHVMLEGLTQDLKVGETIKLTLQFAKSGAITLEVPIQVGN